MAGYCMFHALGVTVVQPPTIIARAFELARDGSCKTSVQIRTMLVGEGYEHVHQHLASPTIVKQLRKLLREKAADPAIVPEKAQKTARAGAEGGQ